MAAMAPLIGILRCRSSRLVMAWRWRCWMKLQPEKQGWSWERINIEHYWQWLTFLSNHTEMGKLRNDTHHPTMSGLADINLCSTKLNCKIRKRIGKKCKRKNARGKMTDVFTTYSWHEMVNVLKINSHDTHAHTQYPDVFPFPPECHS